MRYTNQQIAHVIHEANRALQIIHDDPSPSQPWGVEREDIKVNAVQGVKQARDGMTPRELHDQWQADKRAHGWVYGPVKDEQQKTHPCLVPYDNLPEGQRDKNRVFLAIVEAMTQGMY